MPVDESQDVVQDAMGCDARAAYVGVDDRLKELVA
jgi:hypothetical protein